MLRGPSDLRGLRHIRRIDRGKSWEAHAKSDEGGNPNVALEGGRISHDEGEFVPTKKKK